MKPDLPLSLKSFTDYAFSDTQVEHSKTWQMKQQITTGEFLLHGKQQLRIIK